MSVISKKILTNFLEEYDRRFLDKDPYEKQKKFIEYTAQVPIIYLCGGVRSGKSWIANLFYAIVTTGYYPSWYKGRVYKRPVRMAIFSKDLDNFKKTVQLYLLGDPVFGTRGLIHPSLITNILYHPGGSKIPKTITIKNRFYGESTIDIYTQDQGSQKIQGTSYDIVGNDELPKFPIFQEVKSRLIQFSTEPNAPIDYPYGLYIISATPQNLQKNIYHQTAASFFTDDEGKDLAPEVIYNNRMYMLLSWDDNPYLTDEGKRTLSQQYPEHELKLRKYGIPTFGGNLVYPFMDEYNVVIDPFVIPDTWPRFFSADYGMKDETVFLFFAIDPNTKVIYQYGEYCAARLKVHQHVENLTGEPFYANIIPGVVDPYFKRTESDGVSVYKKFVDAGINFIKIAKNSIEVGQDLCYSKMRTGAVKIMTTCPKTIRQLYTLYYGTNWKPEDKQQQDCADGFRYGIISGPDVARSYKELLTPPKPTESDLLHNWMVYS